MIEKYKTINRTRQIPGIQGQTGVADLKGLLKDDSSKASFLFIFLDSFICLT